MARLQQIYRDKIAKELTEKFGYKSPMQVPRITKITLNMGVGEAVADKKVLDNAVGDLTKIAGQKPVVTKSKKAIAGFKIREMQPIGCISRILKPAMAFFDLVTTGFWPAILVRSPTALSMTFLSATASLTPMFSVILVMRGTSMIDL